MSFYLHYWPMKPLLGGRIDQGAVSRTAELTDVCPSPFGVAREVDMVRFHRDGNFYHWGTFGMLLGHIDGDAPKGMLYKDGRIKVIES